MSANQLRPHLSLNGRVSILNHENGPATSSAVHVHSRPLSGGVHSVSQGIVATVEPHGALTGIGRAESPMWDHRPLLSTRAHNTLPHPDTLNRVWPAYNAPGMNRNTGITEAGHGKHHQSHQSQIPSEQHQEERASGGESTDEDTSRAGDDVGANGRPSKRRRKNTSDSTRVSYVRKRALVACRLCRMRKVKCDNGKPCGFCSEHGADCVYPDAKTENPSFDKASLTILDRLDYVVQMLERQDKPNALTEAISSRHSHPSISFANEDNSILKSRTWHVHHSTPSGELMNGPVVTPGSTTLANEEAAFATPTDQMDELIDSMEISSQYRGTPEDVLVWPIFENKYNRNELEDVIFAQTDTDHEGPDLTDQETEANYMRVPKISDPRHTFKRGKGIREEDVIALATTFLAFVHTKNPVLDPSVLMRMARSVAEDGFSWDARTCLILIVCALGTLCAPFSLDTIDPTIESDQMSLDSIACARDYSTAEDYYTAARKRIGLLGNSIISCQCCFFFGVYEMYSLRPLQAWTFFNRACILFQTSIGTRWRYNVPQTCLSANLKLRLYWSCLKSEHEVRIEIKLPSSGIAKLKYFDSFPSPPERRSHPVLENYAESSATQSPNSCNTSHTSGISNKLQEKSWYYYLADIAARRIYIRVINSFYTMTEQAWIRTPVNTMMNIANELEAQLTEWASNLPSPVDFQASSTNADELTFHLEARCAEIRERIYRPFLYIAIHSPAHVHLQSSIHTYVQTHLGACARLINQWLVKHRHHGTWAGARQALVSGVCMLAAVKSGTVDIPEDVWKPATRSLLKILMYWEREAKVLKLWRVILREIAEELGMRDDGHGFAVG